MRRNGYYALALLGAMVGTPHRVRAHPLHTSLVRIHVVGTQVQVRVRAFSDDFSAAVTKATRTTAMADLRVADVAAATYLRETFRVAINGSVVDLQLVSQQRDGDVTWIELRGESRVTPTQLVVENRILADVHKDLVNVVQAHVAGRARTVLFAVGAGAKAL